MVPSTRPSPDGPATTGEPSGGGRGSEESGGPGPLPALLDSMFPMAQVAPGLASLDEDLHRRRGW